MSDHPSATSPTSTNPVTDMGSYYRFEAYPGVYFNKVIAGRPMTVEDFHGILAGRELRLEGFISKTGAPFAAVLVFSAATKRFDFQKRKGTELAELCPKSNKPIEDMGTYWQFPGFPGFFNKTVAKRPVALGEYIAALTSKEPIYLTDFISVKERPFTAAFVYDVTARRMNFKFQGDGGSAPRASAARPPARPRSDGDRPSAQPSRLAAPAAAAGDFSGF